jgi:hypothetical protein
MDRVISRPSLGSAMWLQLLPVRLHHRNAHREEAQTGIPSRMPPPTLIFYYQNVLSAHETRYRRLQGLQLYTSNSCIFPPGLVFFRHPGTVIPRLIHFFVPVHCRGERLPPSVSRVDVVGSQDRPLAVTAVVEAEERVIAGGGKVAVTGGALLTAVDGGPGQQVKPWGQQTPKSSAPLSSPWNTQ